MICSNCGTQNNQREMFCSKCGIRLDNMPQPQQNGNMQYSNNNWTPNQTYIDKAVNPNMKKWAILSIVVPAIGIVWYMFIGLSFYIAIVIAAAGFGFAQKGEMTNKKMAIVGKVLSGILTGMAIVMLILQLIAAFGK